MKKIVILSLLFSSMAMAETMQIIDIKDSNEVITLKKDETYIFKFPQGSGIAEKDGEGNAIRYTLASLSTHPKKVNNNEMDPDKYFGDYLFCYGSTYAVGNIPSLFIPAPAKSDDHLGGHTYIEIKDNQSLVKVESLPGYIDEKGEYFLTFVIDDSAERLFWKSKEDGAKGYFDTKIGQAEFITKFEIDADREYSCRKAQVSMKVNIID